MCTSTQPFWGSRCARGKGQWPPAQAACGPQGSEPAARGLALPAASLCASNTPRGAACLSADTALPVQATLSLRYLLLRDNPS